MRFTKPAWVQHQNEDKKRTTICSVHVHPDCSRVATGGLDTKVRIWATKPILKPEAEAEGRPPKLLCTLGTHVGPVMAVRWTNNGRWLASGSDDSLVMIWDLDPNGGGKVWGSDEVNVEGWKALKRLPGHSSDVVDLAWHPKDRYLASVGLDNMVFIWCGVTLERLHRLEGHQGFVKGVCWDPVGEYLATQSDDRTVKVWRTTDWSEVRTISKPFVDSPGSTWFRRLSWSPDGAHITASNAMNAGAVFIATVISRDSWQSDISLVGHENTVEAACYNPHIFLRETDKPVQTNNICSVVALGAGDGSVSVWQTKNPRPLVVGKEAFTHPILDLSWSSDGLTLYAVSFDGTMAVFDFDREELEGIAPTSAQEGYLKKFGFSTPELPATGPLVHYTAPAANTSQVVNQLVARKGGKKRAQLNGSIPSAATNGRPVTPTPAVNGTMAPAHDPFSSAPLLMPGSAAPDMRFPSPSPMGRFGASMDVEERERKRRRTDSDGPSSSAFGGVARTLGGDRPRPVVAPGAKREVSVPQPPAATLPLPKLQTVLSISEPGVGELEALHPEDSSKPAELAFMTGAARQVHWMDYLPSPALGLAISKEFVAAGMVDGGVNVYSLTGRRLMPTLQLAAPCSWIAASGSYLLVLTCTGMLYLWNIVEQKSAFAPHSIMPVLANYPGTTVVDALVRDNGVAVVNLTSGVSLSYDAALQVWTRVAEPWWSAGSAALDRLRGPVSELERYTAASGVEAKGGRGEGKWWSAAMTLGHLETRIHAARALDSQLEWKGAMMAYARRIADEGLMNKADELAHELCGPIYWRPGAEKDKEWEPMVVGLEKRQVLTEVLGVFASSQALAKMAADWQELLKRLTA
ncbi:WD40 repeat-like protein [Exidia glandulosa HHB12029]|uniref:Protein HIR n=1 Tax=Exidia glandulosa HHB12029 TaxID=1314781 RepID=A0A165KTE2_EXIGL|nr:WD40 repeat-like protein [Exidia glandulosa HHB12029]